jgi:hypothetical protein
MVAAPVNVVDALNCAPAVPGHVNAVAVLGLKATTGRELPVPGPINANWPAVVQALDSFWHWYRPAVVEQNELAAPVVGGVVEQAEMVPEPPVALAEGLPTSESVCTLPEFGTTQVSFLSMPNVDE